MSINIGSVAQHGWLYDYQTLLAGVLAILAAIGSSWALLHATTLPLKQKLKDNASEAEAMRSFLVQKLHLHSRTICLMANAFNNKIKEKESISYVDMITIFEFPPPPFSNDWSFMRHLDPYTLDLLYRFEIATSVLSRTVELAIETKEGSSKAEPLSEMLNKIADASRDLENDLIKYGATVVNNIRKQ